MRLELRVEAVETVKQLKRENKLVEAEKILLKVCASDEASNAKHYEFVAPWFYEQLAIIYRKQQRFTDEVEILELYYRQLKQPEDATVEMECRLKKASLLASKASTSTKV